MFSYLYSISSSLAESWWYFFSFFLYMPIPIQNVHNHGSQKNSISRGTYQCFAICQASRLTFLHPMGKTLLIFLFPSIYPVSLNFSRRSSVIIYPRYFLCLILILIMSILFSFLYILIFHRCLPAPSLENSITFCRTVCLLLLVFSSSMERLSIIHCHTS